MARPTGVFKTQNAYSAELGDLFEEMPKAVLAALAVSFATVGGDYLDEAKTRLANEWRALHEAGVVPQKPGRIARQHMSDTA